MRLRPRRPHSPFRSSCWVQAKAHALASDPGQAPWLVELVLEIFIDQVEVTVVFKPMQFLLGKKEWGRNREKGRMEREKEEEIRKKRKE